MVKHLKTLIALVALTLSVEVDAQNTYAEGNLPDSLIILTFSDEMTDKKYYTVSHAMIVANESKSKGIKISPTIQEGNHLESISIKVINIGSCQENSEIIILFKDGEKIKAKQWNDFNCKGTVYIDFTKDQIKQLKNKEIDKIRFTDGRDFDSVTAEPSDPEYFIKLYRMLELNQISNLKAD